MKKMRLRCSAMALALVACTGAARAGDALTAPAGTVAATSLPQVDVSGKRAPDPAMLPAKVIYHIQRAVDTYGEGRIKLKFRLKLRAKDEEKTADKDLALPAGLRVWVELDDEELPVSLDQDGTLRLPALSAEQAARAKLLLNQAKGKIRLDMDFGPVATKETLSPGTLRQTNVAMDRVLTEIKQLLPWAFRWMLPEISGLALCQPQGEGPAVWQAGGRVERVVYLYESTDKRLNCALLRPSSSLPEEARLQVVSEAELMPWVNGITGRKSR